MNLGERLSANIKLTLYKADIYLLKSQRLQNKVLRTIGNLTRCTPVCDFHTAFNLPHVFDYITKLCRQQAEVIQNHENEHVRGAGQGLNLAVVKLTTVQVPKLPL
jgi:hypothetical protein